MEQTSTRELVKQGLTILRHDGPIAATKAGLRTANLNHRSYWWYLRYLYRAVVCRRCQTSNPFTLIWIDPDRILRRPSSRIGRWDDLGAVLEGNWDQPGRPLETSIKYRSVVDRFEDGTPWEETDLYQKAIERVKNGDTFWNGSLTADDVEERTEHVDDLYETIREEGYRSQAERHGRPLREIVLSRTFDRSMEEVAVAIGRDGEPLFVDGNHRLAIAHVLDLESIPVHVIARHKQWEAIREKARSATDPEQLDDQLSRHLPHPDLTPLFSDRS